jgi:hypothetical protein
MWNRQRTEEVLLDVDHVALGYVTKMRWNPHDKWIQSVERSHEPLITEETFAQAQQIFAAGGRGSGPDQNRDTQPVSARLCLMQCASAGCRASDLTTPPTTAAGSRRSTPSPTGWLTEANRDPHCGANRDPGRT